MMNRLKERIKDVVSFPVRCMRYLSIHEPATELPSKITGILFLIALIGLLVLAIVPKG